ncbi:MAG: FAD-dependent oxidoreductase [Deltaproteobacteria bacterium]|nr:FAD-dependent oxidoreductase [Deltaproteobacteria bacterium]
MSQASAPSFLPSRPRRAAAISTWSDTFDVIVVGFGVAGGAAAIEAARAGARTLILERQTRGGGATALSEGTIYFGGGTRAQKASGFDDSFENMLAHVRAAAGPTADPEKVRLYCENSLDHFAFFESIGVEFKDTFFAEKVIFPPTDDCLIFSGNEEAWPFSAEAKPMPRGHKPKKTGSAGAYIIEQMIDAATKLGVEIQNEVRVETLIRDDEGRVVGVVAKIEGQEVAIRANRGVILTTGGFIMNRAMVEHYAPDLAKCRYPIGSEGCDGSGIRMGMGVGGAAVNMHEGLMTTAFFPPTSHIKGVLVSAQGQRFINEDCYHGRVTDAIMQKADGRAYLIVDDTLYGQAIVRYELAGVEETIEELEKTVGLPEGQLVHTIASYNKYAEQGEDPVFHKAKKYLTPLVHPPFAALDLSVDKSIWATFTLGGLDTKATGEVLTVDGQVVPGLYAAGRASAGLTRSGRYYASGMSIGGGSYFGRLAGKTAAKAEPAVEAA